MNTNALINSDKNFSPLMFCSYFTSSQSLPGAVACLLYGARLVVRLSPPEPRHLNPALRSFSVFTSVLELLESITTLLLLTTSKMIFIGFFVVVGRPFESLVDVVRMVVRAQ